MTLYTIGFTQKTAEQFFETLKNHEISLLIDIRLNNSSQLSGFAKSDCLPYFLKEICGAEYLHISELAPTKEILDDYKKKKMSWNDYEVKYRSLIQKRDESSGICKHFSETYRQYQNIVLLCSEPTAEKCHRRLAAELICQANPEITVRHI